MNDADRKAFEDWNEKHGLGFKSHDRLAWEAACEWRDSQVGEPVAEITQKGTLKWLNVNNVGYGTKFYTHQYSKNTKKLIDKVIELRVKTQSTAQINQQLEKALAFYADPLRYQGPNQKVDEGDKYTPDGFPYRMDVTRDGGEIARAALAATQMRGDA